MARTAAVKETPVVINIMLSPLEKEGMGEVDQTVPVTINGKTRVLTRGKLEQVSPQEYILLKESGKFPELR